MNRAKNNILPCLSLCGFIPFVWFFFLLRYHLLAALVLTINFAFKYVRSLSLVNSNKLIKRKIMWLRILLLSLLLFLLLLLLLSSKFVCLSVCVCVCGCVSFSLVSVVALEEHREMYVHGESLHSVNQSIHSFIHSVNHSNQSSITMTVSSSLF